MAACAWKGCGVLKLCSAKGGSVTCLEELVPAEAEDAHNDYSQDLGNITQ